MFFFKISNANMLFDEKILIWKIYTTNKALFITKQVLNIDPKEFVIVILNVDSKTLVIYMVIWKQIKIPIYFKR